MEKDSTNHVQLASASIGATPVISSHVDNDKQDTGMKEENVQTSMTATSTGGDDRQEKVQSVKYFEHKLSFLWSVNIGLLLFFTALYFGIYVVENYYFYPYDEWKDKTALPNLGASLDRAISIATHITTGIFTMFIGMVQLNRKIRIKNIEIHRWLGRLYVFFAILTSSGGILFIIFNNFETIGGANMTISFTMFGFVWLFFNIAGLVYIRKGDIYAHQRWMLRSYAMSVSSMMYRVWFAVAGIFGYRMPVAHYDDNCFKNGTCETFTRNYEHFNAWWFWIGSLLFIEYVLQSIRFENFQTTFQVSKTRTIVINWRKISLDILALWVLFCVAGTIIYAMAL